MGLGDWLMATADIAAAHEKHGVRCVIGDGERDYWSEVFEGNPKVCRQKDLKPGERFAWVPNIPGNRPYVEKVENGHFVYRRGYRARPGELYTKRLPKSDVVVIEPHVKREYFGGNKAWPWARWQEVVNAFPFRWVQLGPEGIQVLDGVQHIVTKTFTEALEQLSAARLLVTTDGALHHAAVILDVPAVVLWGGLASPENLGYDRHINLWHGAEPCGTYGKDCPHCWEAMNSITVSEVTGAIESLTS